MRYGTSVIQVLVLAALQAASLVRAQGNIDPVEKCAWAENAGWINFASTNDGVMVAAVGLSGYAWAENIGYIKLAADGSTYENMTMNDWGVKLVGKTLRGFAWSENAGWINFSSTNGGVVIGSAGGFDGFAWNENMGWIHFRNASPAYGVRTTASLGLGTLLILK